LVPSSGWFQSKAQAEVSIHPAGDPPGMARLRILQSYPANCLLPYLHQAPWLSRKLQDGTTRAAWPCGQGMCCVLVA
jgi:hypothetical protein